jgi:hypothetical protein
MFRHWMPGQARHDERIIKNRFLKQVGDRLDPAAENPTFVHFLTKLADFYKIFL